MAWPKKNRKRNKRSRSQKAIWAGRSQKERSAIVKKILASRKDSPKWRTFRKRLEIDNRRRVVSAKTRHKLSVAGKGRKLSAAARAKVRQSRFRYWNNPALAEDQAKAEQKRIRTLVKRMSPEARKKYKARVRLRKLRKLDPVAYKEELRRRLSKGNKRKWKDPKVREKIVASIKKAWVEKHDERLAKFLTPEYRKARSEWSRRYGDHSGLTGARKAWYHGPNGRRIWMFSRAEVKYAKWLDSQGIEWLYEAFTFAVVMNGKLRHWTPDFYLVKQRKFIEIKGQEHPFIQRKIKRVMRHYSGTKFELVRATQSQFKI